MSVLLLFFVVSVLSLPCSSAFANPQVCLGQTCVNVDVVSKEADMRRGLQGRDGLKPNQGMLFVFDDDDKHRFWMKDMKFPIDILWLDDNHRIVYVAPSVPACTTDPCDVYTPSQPARYVLEVSSGFAANHGLKPGSGSTFKQIPVN